MTSRSRPILEPRDQTFYRFERRKQTLGDFLVLRDERRVCMSIMTLLSSARGRTWIEATPSIKNFVRASCDLAAEVE